MNGAPSLAAPEAPFFRHLLTLRQLLTSRWALAVLPLPLLGLASGLWGGAPPTAAVPAPGAPLLPVLTVAVEPATTRTRQRVFSGEVRARRSSELGFELGGTIVELLFDEGEHVDAGSPLARLDTRSLQARRDELAAELARNRAVLDELVAGPREQTLAAARARVRGLEEELELARRRRDRRDYLVRENVVAAEELDDAETEADALAARLEAATEELDELEEGTRAERIAAQRAAVDALAAAVRTVDIDLEKSELRAPYDGIVAHRALDEGVVVAPGTRVLRLLEDVAPEARVGVPVSVATDLRPGEAVELEAGGRTFLGTVARILPELDAPTRRATVVLDVDDADRPRLLIDEVVRLHLTEEEPVEGYWVPTAALTRGSRGLWAGYAVVREAAEERVERRDLEVLFTEGERSLVRGVLSSGDRLIAGGLDRVVPGQAVHATPAASH